MSITKRVLALAAAGVTALVLGGVLTTTHQPTRVDAAGASFGAVGCANSTAAIGTGIIFPVTAAGFGPQTTAGLPAGAAAPGTLSVVSPAGAVECGAVFEDLTVPAAGVPGAALITDADPTTIDGGTITYTITGGGAFTQILESNGPTFSINCGSATPPVVVPAVAAVPAGATKATATLTDAGAPGTTFTLTVAGSTTPAQTNPVTAATVAAALNSLAPVVAAGGVTATGGPTGLGGAPVVITWNVAGPAPTITATPGPGSTAAVANTASVPIPAVAAVPAGVAAGGQGGLESCQGAVPAVGVAGAVSPNPGNVIHVGFRPGATFGVLGTAGIVATPATLTATYTRFPSLTASGVAAGPSTLTVSTTIAFPLPVYTMSLTPNPATIPANGSAGSVITAALSRIVPSTCVVLTGTGFSLCTAPGTLAGTAVAGVESGVVTFTTTSGVFGAPAAASAGTAGAFAQQIASVHCGGVPAAVPSLVIPVPIAAPFVGLTSCTTASVTLFGGGAAGTAIVAATFVGDITGATAFATTTVAFSVAPAVANLTRGCNEVITPASIAANTPIATIVGMVSPSSAVVSIWQFNNALHAFQAGFFNVAGAPTDFSTVGPNQSLFICVSGAATFPTV